MRTLTFALFFILCWACNPCLAQDSGFGLSLRLLYQIPDIESDVRQDAVGQVGTTFSAEDALDANTDFFLPAFEIEIKTGGFGHFVIEYFEFRFKGADFLRQNIFYDSLNFQRGDPVRTRYEFRTAQLTAVFDWPLMDWFDFQILFAGRWVQFFSSLTSPASLLAADDTTETIVPAIGAGVNMFLLDQFEFFGSFRILQYSIAGGKNSKFLFLDDDSEVFTRDWRLGAKYSVVEWMAVSLEYRSLRVRLKKNKARYRQDYNAWTLGVEVRF